MRVVTPARVLDLLARAITRNRRKTEVSWAPLKKPLFAALRQMGTAHGYKVYDSATTGEFLWDLTWEDWEDRSYRLDLAAEIELSPYNYEDLLDDFYKVLNALARLKVFIGVLPSRNVERRIREEITWATRYKKFRLPDEHLIVLLVSYDGSSHEFLLWKKLFNLTRPAPAAKWDPVRFGW